MAIGNNSYGTMAEVVALTRIYLQGETTFNNETIPAGVDVEKFIDRASGVLNLALANAGFTIPITQADAKLACDDWVVGMAAAYVELSQPYTSEEPQENKRSGLLSRLSKEAVKFVKDNTKGFAVLGVTQTADDSSGLIFTGATAQADRTDPTDTGLEQPKFSRGQFDS